MQHRHHKHLRAYLEAWSDALINDDTATPWNANTVNEELAAVEDCLSSLDRVWPQSEASEASPSDVPFSSEPTSSSKFPSSGKVQSPFSVPQEGSLVGRFRLERKLGAGGMGVVYLAEDTVLQRFVAVKLPLQKATGVVALSERFQREAAAAARLRHTNIVGVLESGTDHGHNYIVSEWIDGPDLKHWFTHADKPLEIFAVAACIEQVADGIHCAHDEGILHRDLKPANILLHPRQQHQVTASLKESIPKVTDFGLARDVRSDQDLTNTGEAIGTPAYCAPEQLAGSGDCVGPHSDVFSLGTILYQLLTGTSPFRRGSWLATVQAVQNHHPLPPRSLRSDIPRDLEAVCMKCLQKQPSKRYATAAELRDDLRRFREGRATIARPLPWWEGIQRWSRSSPYRAAFLLVSALLLLTAVVGLSIHSNALHRHHAELTETLAEVDAERNRANQLLSEAQVLRRTAEDRERVARQLAFDSDMRLASSHMERNQLLPASDVLRRHVDTVDRNLTFRMLGAILRSQFRTVTRHKGPAHEVAVVPDAHQVISVGDDGVLRHFDFQTGSPIAELQLDRGPQHAIDVSPDGSTIAVAENAEALQPTQVHLIDSASGNIKDSIPVTRSTVESLRWNADGRMLAIGSRYADVHLWNSQTKKLLTFAADRRNRQLAFFPGPQELLIAGGDALRSWKVDAPTISTQRFAGADSNMMFAASPKHQIVAFRYTHEPIIRVRSGRSAWKETGRLERVIGGVEAMEISPSGKYLAAAMNDGHVQTWELKLTSDYETEPPGVAPVSTQLVHEGPCRSLKFVDDQWLVTGGEDGVVRGFNPLGSPLQDTTLPRNLDQPGADVMDVSMSADGEQIFFLEANASLHLGRISDNGIHVTHSAQLIPHTSHNQAGPAGETVPQLAEIINRKNSRDHQWISVSASTNRAAFATSGNRIAVFDCATHNQLADLVADFGEPTDEWFTAIAISPDGQTVAAACTDTRLRLWSVDDSQLLLNRKYTDTVECVCFSPNSQQLIVGGRFEQLKRLSLPDGNLIWRRQAGDGAYGAAFSADASTLVTGHGDGTVRIWDTSDNTQQVAMHGHATPLSVLTLADNDQTVASIDERGDVNLWNVRTRQPIGRIFTQAETRVRFHRLLIPPRQTFAYAVVSTHHGERLLKRIDLRPRR